ncbi:nucleoside permease [Bacillus sp. SM-B1]|uniref:nucleoside permease n=1 Tax=Bacillus sp. SM-B1 TaxID=2980102 RepID=UPI002948FBBC|nr:nucleoside permease [Bacillus sp. SM-B1]MDV6040413.1 nucleoside permease [Bacillus sp. SM-B1]
MPSWISEENLQKALNNGISYHTLYDRIRSGWTIKEAITTPPVRGGIFTKEEREISESNGISYKTAYARIVAMGMSVEEAITTPLRPHRGRNCKHGQWKETALENGIPERTFYNRLRLGWTYQNAATKPVRRKDEIEKKWLDIAKNNGIGYHTFLSRIRTHKWDMERAATTPVINTGRRCSMKDKEGVS